MQRLMVALLFLLPCRWLWAQTREGSSFDQSKFVPDIALIVDFSGVARSIQNEQYYSLAIPGFDYPFLDQTGSSGSNAHRGWNFNYGELSLASVVDPYFDMFAVIDLAPEGAGIEEAYFSTLKLPYGLKVKAGKFLATFGRINEQHEHYWDFANRPLIAAALFGENGLNEIGAQVTWVPPTPFYLTLGAEVLNGTNQESFGTTGFSDPNGNVNVNPIQGPGLYIGFVRTSLDLDEASILLGISNAVGTTRTDQGFTAGSAGTAVNANTDILGADLTIKYSLDAIRNLSVQSEYMFRMMNGTEYNLDVTNAVTSTSLDKKNSGFYVQCAAKLDQLWRIGARYDVLAANDIKFGGLQEPMPANLQRYSAMIEFNPTEFSRLRLQVDRDQSHFTQTGGLLSRVPYTQVTLQANLTIGAHGAHAF